MTTWAVGYGKFPQVQFRRLFEPLSRPVPTGAEIVTAYTDGEVTLRSNRRLDGYHEAADLSGFQGVRAGDFVVHGLDILRGSVGVSDSDGAISAVCTVCAPRGAIDPRFFAYAIRAQAYSGFPRAMARGIREGGADFRRWDTLGELPLPLPPDTQQRAIADYLDAETTRIDALAQLSKRQQQLNSELMRTRIVSAMDRLAAVRGTIPLRRLVTCLDGRRVPLNAMERSTRQGPYPYYGASGIVDHIDDYLFDETLVLLGEDGAQLGDPTYPVAQVVVGKVWVNNHAHVLRPHADPAFLVFRLNTFDRMLVMSGSTREKITQEDMGRIPVPNVPRAEQVQLAAELESGAERTTGLNEALQRRVDLLHERRQALITAAVTGQLDIPGVAA